MLRRVFGLVLAVAIAVPPSGLAQQTPTAVAADLQAGIRQVDEGDLDAAVITLDAVVLRLKQMKGAERDLATAHLYSSMAHLGLSQIEKAKAEMREAWRNNRGLALDPKKFPPRVIQLYEQMKNEQQQAEATTPKPATAASPQPAPKPTASPAEAVAPEKGGSKLPLILLGGAALVGGGVAIAATGGSGGAAASAPMPTPTPQPAPTPAPVMDRVFFINSTPPAGGTVRVTRPDPNSDGVRAGSVIIGIGVTAGSDMASGTTLHVALEGSGSNDRRIFLESFYSFSLRAGATTGIEISNFMGHTRVGVTDVVTVSATVSATNRGELASFSQPLLLHVVE